MALIALSKIIIDNNVRKLPDLPEGVDLSDPNSFPAEILESIKELALTIKQDGLLQSLGVKEAGRETYRLIYGWRRYMALKLNGATVADCRVIKGRKEDEQYLQLVENIQRENLSPGDIAVALKTMKEDGMKQNAIAERLGKSEGWVSYHIGLLSADSTVVDAVSSGEVTASAARSITALPKEEQKSALDEAKAAAKAAGKKKVSRSATKVVAERKKKQGKGKVAKKDKGGATPEETSSVTPTDSEKQAKADAVEMRVASVVDNFVVSSYGDAKPSKSVIELLSSFARYLIENKKLK